MKIRKLHIAYLLAALLLIFMIGCGGGGGSSAPPIDDQLFTPNYIDTLYDRSVPGNEGLFRWNHLPVTVSFDLPSNWTQLYPGNQDLYIRGANEWNQSGKQTLVTVVSYGMPADVVVQFVPQSTFSDLDIRGDTQYTHDGTYMHSASIRIALDKNSGQIISAGDTQTTIAHELGHALGIGGHSSNPSDLMYSIHNFGQDTMPTDSDLNTIMSAYPSYFGRAPLLRAPQVFDPNAPVVTKTIE